jgi:hypothetical protein
MSKNNNVNPNFYKIGGRDHAEGHGEVITHEQDKQELATGNKKNSKAGGKEGQANFIPGEAPVGEKKKKTDR